MFEMHSARRGERKGARRESAHLSNGGNYSTTPSPVTRGSGGWGCSKGGWEGLGGMGWVVAATQKAIGPRPLVLSLPTSTMRG